MAALALPLIEGAVDALLAAFATTAAVGTGVVVVDQVQKRAKAASESKDKAIAQTATTSAKRKACDKCPPDCGQLVERNWNMSEDARAYQAKITGFTPRTEWGWMGSDFDGFKSTLCQLQEAKANYDQFFDKDGDVKIFFGGFRDMSVQAVTQAGIVRINPPASLNWYFQTPKAYALMYPKLSALGITAAYVP